MYSFLYGLPLEVKYFGTFNCKGNTVISIFKFYFDCLVHQLVNNMFCFSCLKLLVKQILGQFWKWKFKTIFVFLSCCLDAQTTLIEIQNS